MRHRRTIAFTLFAIALIVASETAFGQVRSRSRRPSARSSYGSALSRPHLSPYLNLLRNDQDVATNYYTLVRPQVRQQRINTQFAEQMDRQDQNLTQLQEEVSTVQGSGLGGRPVLPPTGLGARYMDLSHYYSRSGSRRQTRGR